MNGQSIKSSKPFRIAAAVVMLAPSWGLAGEMRFVSPAPGAAAVLEMRSSATITGHEVTLRDICRWSDADAEVFEPVGGVILARAAPGAPLRSITLDEVRSAVRDAGINLARIRFTGATTCTITHDPDAGTVVYSASPAPSGRRPERFVRPSGAGAGPDNRESQYTLRDHLLADLAQRLRLPGESLQVRFHPHDEAALNTAGEAHQFHIEPRRARDLGEVSWDVLMLAEERSEKLAIGAQARAWQQQLVVIRPIAPRQVIRAEDLSEQRVLVDRLSEDPLLTRPQVVGQQSARELRPGMVLTARMIEAAPLVRSGQLVTLTLFSGGVQITTVARAMETGAYGQTIRLRNETTRDQFEAVVTGPQAAALGGVASR